MALRNKLFLTAISFAIAVLEVGHVLGLLLFSALLSIVEHYSALPCAQLCRALSFAMLSALRCAQLCHALSFALRSALSCAQLCDALSFAVRPA